MRTTINISDDLLAKAKKATGLKTKTMVVNLALQELIHKDKIEELKKMRGKVSLNKIDLGYSRKR